MRNLDAAIKIIYNLGTDFSIVDWHKTCSKLIDLTGITENSLNDIEKTGKSITEGLNSGEDGAAISIIWNFIFTDWKSVFPPGRIMDTWSKEIQTWLEVRENI